MPGRPKSPHLYVEEDRGFTTPCWIWQRARCADGFYGHLRRDGRDLLAHRFFYEERHGPIPEGKQLDHLCEMTLCVNPDHLEAVSGTENTRRGNRTKLTADQVSEIKARLARGEQPTLAFAEEFGVRRLHIWRIKRGLSWVEEAVPAPDVAAFLPSPRTVPVLRKPSARSLPAPLGLGATARSQPGPRRP